MTYTTQCQFVVDWDILLNIHYGIDFTDITERNQQLVNKSNASKNKYCIDHDYIIDNEVIIFQYGHYRKLKVSFNIVQWYINKTVQSKCCTVTEHIHIHWLIMYTTGEQQQ